MTRKQKTLILLVLLGLVAAGAGVWHATKPEAAEAGPAVGRSGPRGPLPVSTEAARIAAMPVSVDAIGTVEAKQSVEVRPQVAGRLQQVLIREGDTVQAGQALFRLDTRAAEAGVAQARAILARDEARLAEARTTERRLAPLVAQEYISRQEYSQALAEVRAAEATVAASRAAVQEARVGLVDATLTAPISGRAGVITAKAGSMVTAGATEALVTINSMAPVLIRFDVPQQYLAEVRRGQGQTVLVRDERDNAVLAEGRLVFVDNAVDPGTGTITLKAESANPGQVLWPGQMVDVRLILRVEPQAVVVPAASVRAGQSGDFVYVVNQGRARVQPVTVARRVGEEAVIARGLRGGEPVITQMPSNLRPNAEVQLETGSSRGGMGRPDTLRGTSPPTTSARPEVGR